MANLGAPVKVSPIIKGARWSSLILGYYYGKQKLSAYKIIDAEDKKHRAELRKERAAKLAKEKKLKEFIKKLWMLYAEQNWIKAIDLKSAVERLYEKLVALEFDADHEAIYGMERYYTVQQCEELRDKYKIGRKVCRKFLKGKTCSQCLVKRNFFDTINKYTKDCSDSDTSSSSSDEEECKAVEQNGITKPVL
ncbi:hypothetical protein FQA39_LY17252 [Lamprigera yunnana]|nr:hypothetical protein FQA39_LY17252 [Lamprigera yunnana]